MTENLTPEQVVEKIDNMFKEKTAEMPTKQDVADLKSQIEGLKSLEQKSTDLELAIAKFEGKLEAMSEKALNNNVKPMTMAEAIAKAYVDNHTKIKETAEKGGMMTLDVKADTTITGSYTGNIALSTLEPGVNNIARPVVKIRNIVNLGTTSSKFVTYIAQTTQTSADWTNEAGVKVEGSPTWVEVSEEVKKIAGTIKVSKEMLDDLSFIRSEINRDLMSSVEDGMENALSYTVKIIVTAVPFSILLSICISACKSRAISKIITKPNPVPSAFSLNPILGFCFMLSSFFNCSSLMPTPVSAMVRINLLPCLWFLITMLVFSLYLTAFEMMFWMIMDSIVLSVLITSSGFTSLIMVLPFAWAISCNSSAISSTKAKGARLLITNRI